MARRGGERVLLYDANGILIRPISLRDAHQLMADGVAKDDGGWRDRCDRPIKFVQLISPRLSKNDPATITKSEMEVNAGGVAFGGRRVNKHHPEYLGNHIDAVMTKIEDWPFIGDTKAIRVCPVAIPA